MKKGKLLTVLTLLVVAILTLGPAGSAKAADE